MTLITALQLFKRMNAYRLPLNLPPNTLKFIDKNRNL